MKKIIIILITTIALSSCNFYKPAMINAPVLEEKGEINLGLNVVSGTDVVASYAITDHLAASASVTSNASVTLSRSNGSTTETFEAKNIKYDFALGYFNGANEEFNYNFFAGYSTGEAGSILDGSDNILFINDLLVNAQYSSFFVQGAGFTNVGGNSFIGLVAKANSMEFRKFKFSETVDQDSEFFPNDKSHLVGQAGIQYNYKGKKFGITAQFQYAFSDSDSEYFSIRKSGLHIGGYFRIGQMFKK